MRNMSFSMTTQAFREKRKTVTRRLGWWNLKPGDVVMGVEKAQGLKKGEKVVRLGSIRIVSVTREPLFMIAYYPNDCEKEGFLELCPHEFIETFCSHNGCSNETLVNRIEFEYL
jgi:hypothetical protein